MVALKVEKPTVESTQKEVCVKDAAMPESSKHSLRDSLKKDTSKLSADAIEIVAGETVLDPQQLMKMYLLGKLTQGQLSHELKKYNDVQADSIIKFGKQDVTKIIDYREVGRGNPANPGGDCRPEGDQKNAPPPKNAKDAKKESSEADDPKKKKELEKQQQKMQEKESLVTLRTLNNFTDTQREQKNAHAWREIKRKEEEQKEEKHLDKDPRQTSVDKASKRSQAIDKLRSRVHEEIQKELDKAKAGPTQGTTEKPKLVLKESDDQK